MRVQYRNIKTLLFDKKNISQLKRYLATGFMSVGLEYSTLFIMTNIIGIWHIVSNSIAIAVSFCFNFMLNRCWSFKSKQSLRGQLVQYGTLFIINMCISNAIIYLLCDRLGIYYIIPKFLSTVLITLWNFIIYKKVIYK